MPKIKFSFSNPNKNKCPVTQPNIYSPYIPHTCPCEPYRPTQALWPNFCDYFNLGDPAPDFTLQGVCPCTGKAAEFKLTDYLGKWVVLFFYGSDFTFV